ncbi:hypothetical protein [Pseudoruegeria sp. HB172150]|uniref:hypothetical protein n=1 Tax=Pseudoruegeria sp. HB172150 TaxID=2721164 RepID=UPI0015581DD2|nr:hypothetical protein [Pseudoruegeria sp. HB172150]
MGLDIIPLPRAKAGHEAEFREIFLKLRAPDTDKRAGLWGKLKGRVPSEREGQVLTQRFQEISEPHYLTIEAPEVGRDAAADEWVREAFAEGRLSGIQSVEDALAQLSGYRVLEIMPESDGFPVYSNGDAYEGVDRASFRGSFLTECENFLPEVLLNSAWKPMLAEELSAWGDAVAEEARKFAETEGVVQVLGKRDIEEDLETPARSAHIADSAARWALFWSARAHGSDAYF